jgi:hypothetical protein
MPERLFAAAGLDRVEHRAVDRAVTAEERPRGADDLLCGDVGQAEQRSFEVRARPELLVSLRVEAREPEDPEAEHAPARLLVEVRKRLADPGAAVTRPAIVHAPELERDEPVGLRVVAEERRGRVTARTSREEGVG